MSDAAIAAEGLVKTYPRGVRALDGLGVEVPAGTIFGLLGPNGAGKSTTVRILTTLSIPDEGTARVAGHDVLRNPDRVRRAIGVVAQRSGVDPDATGRENLDLQARLHDMDGRDRRARVDELLRQLGLADAANRPARTYSGGMARRLDIALALVHRPSVLFLDEPTTGLDPEVRAEIWDEVRRLAADGITILLTTHYLEEADRLADRLAIVDRGRVVAEGAPEQLKAELHGDAVIVELEDRSGAERAAGALGAVPGVREVALDGPELRARVERGATALPGVLAALETAGARAAAVTVAQPSLDDVYLLHAGRSFARAHDQLEEAA